MSLIKLGLSVTLQYLIKPQIDLVPCGKEIIFIKASTEFVNIIRPNEYSQ